MTEGEARSWLEERHGRAKADSLATFVNLLLAANKTQNLISTSSEKAIWDRHILDSAQLLAFAPNARSWLDVGSGAGLPGLILAIISERPILLVEPRRKRVEFLREMSERLSLSNVTIQQAVIERVSGQIFDAVTARAYAALPDIFASTVQLTNSSTIWVLPKGRSAGRELDEARQAWQGVFHVERSLTDEQARIIVATGIRPR